MGAARSRSHRAGGRPSFRTRRRSPHAVCVVVAAEARGPPREDLFFAREASFRYLASENWVTLVTELGRLAVAAGA